MAGELQSIINVSISRQTAAVTQAGFGVPLVIGPNAGFAGVRSYASLTEVGADFSSSDAEYKMAAALFGQSLSLPLIKIAAAVPVAGVQVLTLEGTATAGSMSLAVNGQAVGPIAFNTDTDTSIAAVASAIQALDDVATAVASTGAAGTDVDPHEITVTFNAGYGDAIVISADFTGISASSVVETTPAQTMSDLLGALTLNDPDFYFVLSSSSSVVDVLSIASWTEANQRLFFTRSSAAGVKSAASTTDIAAVLKAASRDRTLVSYSGTAAEYPDAAWVGRCAPAAPGSINWAYKTLSGVSPDALTSTERNAVLGKNANVYIALGGVNITQFGTMASGEYVDNMRGSDWVAARIQERIYRQLVTLAKIPFTNQGIALVEAEIRGVLQDGVAAGFLEPDFTVSVPLKANVPANDRAGRLLPDVTFSAQIAGAINKANIVGVLTI